MVAAAATTTTQTQKPRWGDLEDDGQDLEFLLPPKQVIGPDENGVKKVIEYKFTDDGQKVKTTRNIRIRKLAQTRLNKHSLERRSWPKFGDAVDEDVGSRLTMISIEEIVIESPRVPGTKQEEDTKATEEGPISQNKVGAVIKVCRNCGKRGDHWTARCPNGDPTQLTDTFIDKSSHTETGVTAPGGTKNSYVPPGMRAGATDRHVGGGDMRRRNEENSVRVTNLSEDTREEDLHDLFRPFGQISRVYVALDQKTGASRGFGFVNFVSREDGERAINKINGYGYDNLILKVEWAAPRPT